MLKVLLADDNYLVLEKFIRMIDWKQYGFEIVSTAIDGKKAFIDFEKYHPDIVITDIQMPILTGIELAEKIRSISPDTIIFFLTSYEEFSYVKSAIDLNVCGYLLKHETDKEKLIEVLEKAKHQIRNKKLQDKYSSAPLYSLINDLNDEQVIEESIYEYEISFPEKYDMLLLEQDHIHPILSELFHVKVENIREKAMLNYCYETISNIVAMISLDDYKYLLLVRSLESITEFSYDIQRKLSKQFQSTFFVLVVANNSPILTCIEKYIHIKDIMDQKFFYPRSSITHGDYIHPSSPLTEHFDSRKIEELLKNYKFDDIYGLIDRYFLLSIDSRDDHYFNHLIRYFSSILASYNDKVVDFQTGRTFHINGTDCADSWYDANSIYHWIKYKFVELSHFLCNADYFRYSDVTRQTIKYIKNNYMNSDLSVEMIAKAVRMNPNQLNIRFKKETGETIWKFIVKVRMDKAKDLLNMGNDRVTDICQTTGYKNISYFSKVFKSTFGMTPLEYRRENYEN